MTSLVVNAVGYLKCVQYVSGGISIGMSQYEFQCELNTVPIINLVYVLIKCVDDIIDNDNTISATNMPVYVS